jgi:hypothetical protein
VVAAGVNEPKAQAPSSDSIASSQTVSASLANGTFDWRGCVSRFREPDVTSLAEWRCYSLEFCWWLKEQGLVGLYQNHIAFPVKGEQGEIIGCHFYINDSHEWIYSPGCKVSPFIIGDELSKASQLFVFESYFDALDFADKMGFHQTDGVAIIVTRGASHGRLIKGLLPSADKCEDIYVWPQRDIARADGTVPSLHWLDTIRANAGCSVKVAWISDSHPDRDFDLNDWTRELASEGVSRQGICDKIMSVLKGAQIKEEESDGGKKPKFAAELENDYGTSGQQSGSEVQISGEAEVSDQNEDGQEEGFEELNEDPEPDPEAFYGVTGRLTRAIEPHTEADPMAIQTQLLSASGCAIGHSPYFCVGPTKHFTNLHACLVGRTSKGRKGSSLDFVVVVMKEADRPWVGTCMTSGLSSGEGLIYAVRDPLRKKEQVKKNGKYTGEIQEFIADFGVDDKRLFVTETEFSRSLKAMSRENNILSEIIRCSWDHGTLRLMVKNNPYTATDAHIAIVGHITREELYKGLAECSFFNGFANRFLWLCVKRSKILPYGGEFVLGEVSKEINELKAAIEWARAVEEMERDAEAIKLWGSVYEELSAEIPGKFGAAIGRCEGQVLRLSMNYALLDQSRTIRAAHLKAALALWKYCVDSARHLFLSRPDNAHAGKILAALRRNPKGMTRTEINVEIFQRHLSKTRIDEAFNYLRRVKLADCVTETTDGRSPERWFATR